MPYAGGLAFALPFGTIYSPNITADKDTGIGNWSDAQFLNALHRGVDDEGERLYPAMPYASYTYMTDADALAIKAYLFSLKPVHQENPEDTLSFPFNQRWLMGLWSTFFNADRRFEPNPTRSAAWNRGAYLSEALAHCGECHTPRNLAFALNNRKKFVGALTAGWHAYNISGDTATGVGAWSADELEQYLSTGHAEGRGTASGPMGEAVDASFRYLVPSDIHAIVAYLRTVPAVSGDLPAKLAGPASASPRQPEVSDTRGKMLFAGACAGCHSWTGQSPIWTQATLTGARAVNDPSSDQRGADHRRGRLAQDSIRHGLHAGIRVQLLRCGDRGGGELRDRAVRIERLGHHSARYRGASQAGGALARQLSRQRNACFPHSPQACWT